MFEVQFLGHTHRVAAKTQEEAVRITLARMVPPYFPGAKHTIRFSHTDRGYSFYIVSESEMHSTVYYARVEVCNGVG